MTIRSISPHRVWLIFFGIWALLLTGIFEPTLQSPGLKQWVRVQSNLADRRQEIVDVESRSKFLVQVSEQLESNPYAQEREIRKILGFLGENEVVFDFAP